jgi:hypothetical protein
MGNFSFLGMQISKEDHRVFLNEKDDMEMVSPRELPTSSANTQDEEPANKRLRMNDNVPNASHAGNNDQKVNPAYNDLSEQEKRIYMQLHNGKLKRNNTQAASGDLKKKQKAALNATAAYFRSMNGHNTAELVTLQTLNEGTHFATSTQYAVVYVLTNLHTPRAHAFMQGLKVLMEENAKGNMALPITTCGRPTYLLKKGY